MFGGKHDCLQTKLWTLILGHTALCAISFTYPAIAQAQEQGSRQIMLDEFTRARPAKSTAPQSSRSNSTARTRPASFVLWADGSLGDAYLIFPSHERAVAITN
jgi:hypothetical protein